VHCLSDFELNKKQGTKLSNRARFVGVVAVTEYSGVLCSLVETYRRFGGIYYFLFLHFILYPKENSDVCIFFPADGDSTSLLNLKKFVIRLVAEFLKTVIFNYAWCFLFSRSRVQIFTRRQTDLIKNFRDFLNLSSQMSRVTPRPFHFAYFEFGIHHSTLYYLSHWKRC
jgi:hypothetical protein